MIPCTRTDTGAPFCLEVVSSRYLASARGAK